MADDSTIHASAILVGPKALLIRGPAGSGKSLLTWNLLEAASQGLLPFARLVGDDRVNLDVRSGRLLVRPARELAGMIEIRGLGLRRVPYEPSAVVGLVVDLAAADAARHPHPPSGHTIIAGASLARLAVAPGIAGLPMVLAALRTAAAG